MASLFDNVIFKKALENIKNKANVVGLDGLSKNERDILSTVQEEDMEKTIEMTLGFGPGAIQKIGSNGQVYGKIAKAVRKLMQNDNVNPNDISKVYRVSTGNNTFTTSVVDSKQITELLNSRRTHGITEFANKPSNWIGVRSSLPTNAKEPIIMHEIGHQFNARRNPFIGKNQNVNGAYNPLELQADVFALSRGHNKFLGEIGNIRKDMAKDIIKRDYDLFKNAIINSYPRK